jgi:hypothetical protein
MRQMSLFAVVAVTLVVVLGGTVVGASAQTPAKPKFPESGLWKQNIEKSKYMTGQPPRMAVRKYEIAPDGFLMVTISSIDTQGNPGFNLGRFKYDDGKDYPIYSNTALAAMVATGAKPATGTYHLVDASTGMFTNKDNTGKVTGTNTRTLSADGKTLTVTAKDATGKVTSVLVFDKQ